MAGQPTPPALMHPPWNKALLRAYEPLISLNKAFLNPYFCGGWVGWPVMKVGGGCWWLHSIWWRLSIGLLFYWICLSWFLLLSTMVKCHQTTIWENMFYFIQASWANLSFSNGSPSGLNPHPRYPQAICAGAGRQISKTSIQPWKQLTWLDPQKATA